MLFNSAEILTFQTFLYFCFFFLQIYYQIFWWFNKEIYTFLLNFTLFTKHFSLALLSSINCVDQNFCRVLLLLLLMQKQQQHEQRKKKPATLNNDYEIWSYLFLFFFLALHCRTVENPIICVIWVSMFCLLRKKNWKTKKNWLTKKKKRIINCK